MSEEKNNNEKSWTRLLRVWREHRDTGFFGIKNPYLDLVHVRNHHIRNIEEILNQLEKDERFRLAIELCGAPVHILERASVRVGDRLYRYVALLPERVK